MAEKTMKNTLAEHATYAKFYEAYRRAREDKASKPEVIRFERHLPAKLMKLLDEVRTGVYRPSPYRAIIVREPKLRTIHALPFRDRVLHQWYVGEFILPVFVPRFIDTSYACIRQRGTHAALRQTQNYLRRALGEMAEPYVLKMDISGFFYNIDKDILYGLVTRRMKDPALKALTRTVISDGFTQNSGIPIGNYTSQYFANIYLNELDHYAKRVLKIKYYLRYMDDFILIVDGRQTAWWVYQAVEDFVNTELKLELNRKSRYYPARYGIDFVGYRTFENYVLLRKRAKRTVQGIIRQYERTKDEDRFVCRAASWLGHASHADTYVLAKKYLSKYEDLIPNRK
jgi:retron-type reverse transcriptase